MADYVVSSPITGKPFTSGEPHIIVIHDLEAPPKDGIAVELANGWLQTAPVSIHGIVDPRDSVRMVPLNRRASHVGGGNPVSVGIEQTGYASWTFEQWTQEHNFQGVRNAARMAAQFARELNWTAQDIRWLTPDQAKSGQRGFATHNFMRLVYGGTTHTDPGPGFPDKIFMQMVQQFFGVPVVPKPDPNPDTPGNAGGAETEDDMPRRIITVVMDNNQTGLAFDGPTGVVSISEAEVPLIQAVIDDNTVANYIEVDGYNAVLARGAKALNK